jgi:DNA-binding CsgD family transcriptional regulator
MTQQEIADKDDVSIRTVQYTLNELEKKLKNFIKYH